jgi:2,4-dienoyl-CoA reductase (NADPH2)
VFDKADKIGGNLAAYAANDLARPADLQSVIDYYGVMAKKLGVEVRLNTEANAKFMRSVLHEYDACIVAAGARTDLESFKYMPGSELLIDALEVAHGKKTVGKRVVMIGGGMIGLTISEFLQKAGHEVTVVEKDKRVGGDIMPTFKWRHTAWVDELGIKTICSAQLVKVTAEGATVRRPRARSSSSPATTSSSPARAAPTTTCSTSSSG